MIYAVSATLSAKRALRAAFEGLGKALKTFSHVSACHNMHNLASFYIFFNSKISVNFSKLQFLLKMFT